MTKVVKSYTSNYKIAVADAGTITLDTGSGVGTVIVTGNLEIQGDTTTINSSNLSIEDNIIILSEGTQGSGLPSTVNFQSGIEIDRGSKPNARWIYDEQVSWTLGGQSGSGTFYAEQGAGGQKLPINTPGIVAQGNFYVDTGNGVISVTNTPDYEEKIFNYENGVIAQSSSGLVLIDDDNIPNAKAVKDYIDYNFVSRTYSFISEGDTKLETVDELHPILDIVAVNPAGNNTTVVTTENIHGYAVGDMVDISNIDAGGDPLENLNQTNIPIVEIISEFSIRLDISVAGADVSEYFTNSGTIGLTNFVESNISFQVEGIEIANVYKDRFDIDAIRIQDTKISSVGSDDDLILSGNAAGSVKILESLEMPLATEPPQDPPQDGIQIFSADSKTGNTGLFYVNSNNVQDEFIGKNRSLLFSMIF